jgi:hypothetical protein
MLSIVKAALRHNLNGSCHACPIITNNNKNNSKVTFDLIEVKANRDVSVVVVALENNVNIDGACCGRMACRIKSYMINFHPKKKKRMICSIWHMDLRTHRGYAVKLMSQIY